MGSGADDAVGDFCETTAFKGIYAVVVIGGLANHEISYWKLLEGIFRVSQFKCLIRLNWRSPSGTAISS